MTPFSHNSRCFPVFSRRRIGFPVQLRPKALSLKALTLATIPGDSPVFYLGFSAHSGREAIAECVPAVLAGGNVVKARRLALHVGPAGVMKIGSAIDVPHVARRRVSIAENDFGGQERQRAGDKPAFGVPGQIVVTPKAVKFDNVLRGGFARADQHVMARRRPEGDASDRISEVVDQAKRERNRRLPVHVMMRHHKTDSLGFANYRDAQGLPSERRPAVVNGCLVHDFNLSFISRSL